MNEKSYQEQMDILVNNFNDELSKKVAGRSIGEIGIDELKQLNDDYAALKELNDGLVTEARSKSDTVDTNVVRDLLNSWDTLNAENNVNVPSITKAIMIKESLVESKNHEIEQLSAESNLLQVQINEITRVINQMSYTLRTTPFPLIANESTNVINTLNDSLKELNTALDKCNDRIKTLEGEIETLQKGGFLEEADTLIRSTANMSVENTEAYLNRRNDVRDRKGFEEADKKADSLDMPPEPEVDYEKNAPDAGGEGSAETEKEEEIIDLGTSDPVVEGTPETESEKEETKEAEAPEVTTAPPADSEVGEELEDDGFVAREGDIVIPPAGSEVIEEPVVSEEAVPEAEVVETPPTAEPVEAPVEAPTVTPEPPKRKTYAETIAEHIEFHGLPGNLTEAKYLEICKALGIPATDLNYKLSSEELIRLRSDREIDIARRNESLFSKQQRRVAEYDKMIAKYEALLNDKVTEDKFDPTYIAHVQALLENLKRSKSALETENAKFNVNAHVEHIAGELDPVSREKGISHKRALEADALNNQIRKEYETLRKQEAVRDGKKSEKIKKREQKKVDATLKRIQNLKTKMGEITRKHVAVINEHCDKYIEKRNNELQRHAAAYQQVVENVSEKLRHDGDIAKIEKDIEALQHDRAELDPTRLRDRVTNWGLKRDIKELQKAVNALQKKQGSCDRRMQQIREFGLNLKR